MPRCFMAKKLKYPYEQWKQQQQNSRSPSPVDDDDDQPIDATIKKPRYDEEEESRLHARSEAAPTFTPPTAHLLAAHYNFLSGFQRPSPAHHASSSLTPPPESSKKDIFRPYCLDDRQIKSERPSFEDYYPFPPSYLQYRNIEDINTAHAILDLSAPHRNSSSSSSRSSTPPPTSQRAKLVTTSSQVTPTPLLSPALSNNGDVKVEPTPAGTVFKINGGKTTAYTYEAFFASDGRSRKKNVPAAPATPATPVPVPDNNKPRYTCTECGKNYATSSNLSRHKQTHRSLDSNNAKKCHVCGKMYVSMPALSMHILTHNLSHKCDVCGKAFSRPWLLQGHMRSHSGDKPYGCAHCGKSFADRSNLRAHMQTHSAFKNFKCKRCNKSFALKSYLNKHYESACFKDQPIPHIDTPPVTPAPSEQSDSSGLASPSSVHSGEHYSSPSINTLLSVLPPSIHAPTPIIPQGQQHLLRV